MKTNLRENIEALRQGEKLLQRMSDVVYTRPAELVFEGTVGAHIRHNLDHYICFLNGLENGCIDYSARQRNSRLERDRSYALAEMSRLQVCLENVAEDMADASLLVKRDVGPGQAGSSVKRELEFLLSHTTHHYAMVAIICRLNNLSVEEEFGVAPSTLRYRATQIA
jgi:hypothetical protein